MFNYRISCKQSQKTMPNQSTETYLVIFVKPFQVADLGIMPCLLVAKPDAIIKIAEPHHVVVIINRSISLKPQALTNGFVVSVSFLVICESSGQMGGDEAQRGVGILESDRDCAFVPCNTRHASLRHIQSIAACTCVMKISHLLQTPVDILHILEFTRPDIERQGRANKLASSKQNIFLDAVLLCVLVQRDFDRFFPVPSSRRISGHDLLRTELYDLLESNSHDLGKLLRRIDVW